MLARRSALPFVLAAATGAAPLCNRSLPVCVVRDNVTEELRRCVL